MTMIIYCPNGESYFSVKSIKVLIYFNRILMHVLNIAVCAFTAYALKKQCFVFTCSSQFG